eukprot:SAG31_NODE_352_length_17229_cov_9.658669_20_plen_74_part_00
MIIVLSAVTLASHTHAATGGGSFVDRFETFDRLGPTAGTTELGSFMLGGRGSDAYRSQCRTTSTFRTVPVASQ